jgi:hypothetical protein
MYEASDALTKYLLEEYSGVIKYVEVNGRTKIASRTKKISDYILNPTFNVVAPPGARRSSSSSSRTPDSMTKADKEAQLTPPAGGTSRHRMLFQPEDRVMLMDEQASTRDVADPGRACSRSGSPTTLARHFTSSHS